MKAVIRACEASVRIGDEYLLTPVSFEIQQGTALAIVGANGSGKTTLLRLLAGLTSPTSGTVEIAGISPDERSPEFRKLLAAQIGYPPLSRNLTMREYLALIGASWGRTLDEANVEAERVLSALGIERLARRFPHELSSGQSQLYNLAVTLARPCSVLLLDEPEQRLDPDRLDLVIQALNKVKAEGVTLVIASHSKHLVDELADTQLGLAEGDAGAG